MMNERNYIKQGAGGTRLNENVTRENGAGGIFVSTELALTGDRTQNSDLPQ